MSTLKVTNIENPDGGGVSAKIADVGGGQLSNRNLIINGAMQVDQRGTSTGISTAGYYAVDRMRFSEASIGTAEYTREQSTDAPDGFGSSLKVTTTTAEGSVAAADAYRPLYYKIEGQDLQQLQYGTSGAKSLTLSFYVKSSVTGTYGLTFQRLETQDRLITATYVISSANTWEYKTITIPGDTSYSITNDNASRFEILWTGGTGTDRTSTDTSGSWTNMITSGFSFGHSSSVQLQNTLNSTWQITGVQLEVGSVATTFEHRSYGEELQKCKRYYQTVGSVFSGETEGADRFTINAEFKPEMRASPTCSVFTGRSARIRYAGSDVTITTPTLNNTSTTIAGVWTRLTTSGRTNAKLVTGRGTGNVDSQFIQVDAEL